MSIEIDPNFSKRFDENLATENQKQQKALDAIWNEHLSEHFPSKEGRKGRRSRTPIMIQAQILILNIWKVWSEDPEMCLGVHMAKKSYTRYDIVTSLLVKIVTKMEEVGLITFWPGNEWSQQTSRVMASPTLIAYFEKAGRLNCSEVYRAPLVLRDKNDGGEKIDLGFVETESTRSMAVEIEAYRSVLNSSFIDIGELEKPYMCFSYWDRDKKKYIKQTTVISQSEKQVRRIFNRASWDCGGRFYGGFWQRIDEDHRAKILIDDVETIEQDYSGFHINLAYGLVQKTPSKGDQYAIDLKEIEGLPIERQWLKDLALATFNAKDRKEAFQAFRDMQEPKTPAKNFTDGTLTIMLDALLERHSKIADLFCSDQGIVLMNIDSQITASIIKCFTDKKIPILTIHDSYITQHQYTGLLRDAMNAGVKDFFGYEIPIDQNGIGIDQVRAFQAMERFSPDTYAMYKLLKRSERCDGYLRRLERFKALQESKLRGSD